MQLPAQRTLRLIAHEQDDALASPQVVLQVVADTTGFAHTAGGQNHFGPGVKIYRFRLVGGNRQCHAVKPDGVDALPEDGQRFLVEIRFVALQENAGGLHRQRRIHVHGKIIVALDETPLLDLPDGVEHLLCPAHGEGGDHQIAAPVQCLLDVARQLRHHVAPVLFVKPVTVGGFNHQEVCFRYRLGVVDQGLVGVAHVAAEYDLSGLLPLGEPQLNGSGTQQMTGIVHAQDDALGHLQNLPVPAGPQQPKGGGSVIHIVHRLHCRVARPLGLSGLPLGFRFLNVGRIHQHDAAQVTGGFRGVDGPGEAVLAQLGQHTGVVNVGMGQEHRLDGGGIHRHRHILKNVRPLLHAAVHQIVSLSNFQQRAAAGDLMGRADELDFHIPTPGVKLIVNS